MAIFFRKLKFLISISLVVLIWWFILRRKSKQANTCDQLFSARIKEYIAKDAFNEKEEYFVGVWASTNAAVKEKCSFFAYRSKGRKSMMLGIQDQSGEYSMDYVGFSKKENGIIEFHPENVPLLTGRVYPLYVNDYALGSLKCSDKDGSAEWSATISVLRPLVRHPKTYNLVSQGLEKFRDLASKLDVDIHLGDFYEEPCFKMPTWKMVSYAMRNDSAN